MNNTLLSLIVALALASGALAQDLAGTWTYRSYHNKPLVMVGEDDDTAAAKALSLIFGEGIVTLEAPAGGTVRGVLDLGPGYALDLSGPYYPEAAGSPARVELVGAGRAGTATAGWEYRYVGFLAPTWEAGVRQVPALVGTVLRAKQHGGSMPGYTTSFMAVKRP